MINKPTKFELRMKSLYEYAIKHNDNELLRYSGFITTNYIEDKNALPLSVYRLRKIIEDIKLRDSKKISDLKVEMSSYLRNPTPVKDVIKKTASTKRSVFRRVSN